MNCIHCHHPTRGGCKYLCDTCATALSQKLECISNHTMAGARLCDHHTKALVHTANAIADRHGISRATNLSIDGVARWVRHNMWRLQRMYDAATHTRHIIDIHNTMGA